MKGKEKRWFSVIMVLMMPFTIVAQQWKEDALARIDEHRKSELTITVLSESGDPIDQASVHVKLTKHAFNFGAVLRSKIYNDSPYKAKYEELYTKYFNCGELEIGMKPASRGKYWEQQADLAVDLFYDNDITLRGHALVWEGYDFMPDDAKDIYDSPDLSNEEKGDSLLHVLDDHLYHAIPKWDVEWWDVINEPVVNNHVNKLLPNQNTFVHWFKLADSLRGVYNKDFKLVLNENQIISANATWAEGKLEQFQAIIDDMIAGGAPIEMIGFQSRIQYGMLSPETMYERLLKFDKYNLPYQATEFEVRDSDHYTYTDAEVEQLTEETMIIYLSHPSVESFWHWTFVDDENGTLPWALFNYNGTPKPTGEKWIEMMEGTFNTDTTALTNYYGKSSVRGYKGEYDIEVEFEGEVFATQIQLDGDEAITLNTPFEYTAAALGVKKRAENQVNILLNRQNKTFKFSENAAVQHVVMFDLMGHKVREYASASSYSMAGIPRGLYLVRFIVNHRPVTKKLIIQ